MIVADSKPLMEIAPLLTGSRGGLVLGCGGCVTVCRSGGLAEARELARRLAHPEFFPDGVPVFRVDAIERQCERDMLEAYLETPPDTDAVLSLACGVGVQMVSDALEPMPVFPALNTTFMGGADEAGLWREKCRGCGDCVLAYTGGICPIARCSKKLLNGPCGGTSNGSCEVDSTQPCAWALIYYRLKKQHKLHLLEEIFPTRDWRPGGGSGPRMRRRAGVAGGPGDFR